MLIALAKLPEIAPFKSPQIVLSRLRAMLVQQLNCAAQVARVQRLLGQVNVGHVLIEAGGNFFLLGAAALLFGLSPQLRLQLLRRLRAVLRPRSAHGLPGADGRSHQQSGGNPSRGGKWSTMAAEQLLQTINIARRSGQDRLAVQVALDVRRQAVGRLVTARTVLLQAFHHDPVEVPAQGMNELDCFSVALPGGRGQFHIHHGGQTRRWAKRLLLSNGTPALIQAGLQQRLGVEGGLAGEQFIEQHT